jgi:hypothetical protein
MCMVGFITQPSLIKRILDHLRTRERVSRPHPCPRSLWPALLEIRPA